MENKKVYALWHDKEKMELKISCQKHWDQQSQKIAKSDETVVYHNSNYFVSFSRTALKKKAEEIRNEWIKEHEEAIKKISNIAIK